MSLGNNFSQEELEDYLRNKYKSSLGATALQLLQYPDINKHTHLDIIEALESSTKRKLIVCPRGALKSTLCVISYSIWRIMRDPNIRILIDSEVYSNSKNFLREIKAHLESERLTSLFGKFRSDSNWTEGSITISQRTKVIKEGTITCSGVGAIKVGQHFDLIIGDDMNSNKNSLTQEGRQKVIDHYKLSTSILEPDGDIVIIGTRYAEDDLIGHILSQEIGLDACSPMGD